MDKCAKKKKELVLDLNDLLRKIQDNFADAEFLVDPLQQALVQRYMQSDIAFRQAMNIDYTEKFVEFLIWKAQRNEPVSLSIMGIQRGGKSSSGITIHAIMMLARGKLPDVKYVVSDKNEYLEMLKNNEKGVCFQIDEDKTAVFGTGSYARKMKLLDVQNIIAVNAISTIWIRPDEFAWTDSQYGLRVFGKYEAKLKDRQMWPDESAEMFKTYQKKGGFMDKEEFTFVMETLLEKQRVDVPYSLYASGKLPYEYFCLIEGERRDRNKIQLTRFMLYNLQESSKVGLPLGMVYLPPFYELPELFDDSEEFRRKYLEKKMAWVHKEQTSSRDVLYKEKMKTAIQFSKDPKFLQLKSRPDRIIYVGMILGSEMTKADCIEIERISKKIIEGFWNEEELRKYMSAEEQEKIEHKEDMGQLAMALDNAKEPVAGMKKKRKK